MLKTKQLLGGLLIIGVSVALIQCKKNTETPTTPDGNGDGTGDGTGGGTTTYTYTKNIATILATNCTCHVTGGANPNLSAYNNVKAANGVRAAIQTGGSMRARSGITNANAEIVTSWIDAGSPE